MWRVIAIEQITDISSRAIRLSAEIDPETAVIVCVCVCWTSKQPPISQRYLSHLFARDYLSYDFHWYGARAIPPDQHSDLTSKMCWSINIIEVKLQLCVRARENCSAHSFNLRPTHSNAKCTFIVIASTYDFLCVARNFNSLCRRESLWYHQLHYTHDCRFICIQLEIEIEWHGSGPTVSVLLHFTVCACVAIVLPA